VGRGGEDVSLQYVMGFELVGVKGRDSLHFLVVGKIDSKP
jgi:hypothetical protein